MNKNVIIIGMLFLAACAPKEKFGESYGPFFDTVEFLEEFETNITGDPVNQIIVLNGKEEILVKDTSALQQIFEIIKKTNINRPSFYDKYQVEKEDNGLTSYMAIDDAVKVKELKISREKEKVSKIEILNISSSLISESRQTITLDTRGIITLNNETQNKVGDPRSLEIKWFFNGLVPQ